MYTIMIFEYNLQTDICFLDHRAMEWLSPKGLQGFGSSEDRYLSICRNIPVIVPGAYIVICGFNQQ